MFSRRWPLGKREVVLVGTQRAMESKLVPEAGLPLETLRVAGLKGIGGMKFVRNVAMLAPGFWDAAQVLRRHRFAAAFGVGGYAEGPMMLMAVLRRIPTVIFEPNAEPGFTNRVLAGMVTRVATAYEAPAKRWGRKAMQTGCPVRREFFECPPAAPRRPIRLLITGGSQGALPVNRAVVGALDLLAARKNELCIVHQTGERDYDAVRVAYVRREINAQVVPFLTNMPERFAQTDLIVCRAGADNQVRLGKTLRHIREEGDDLRVDFPAGIGNADRVVVVLAGLVNDVKLIFSRCEQI